MRRLTSSMSGKFYSSSLNNQLFVYAEKCEFHVSTVSFFGFVNSADNIQMDPAKVNAVAEWSVPTSRKEVQGFLGFAHFYRHFIRDLSSVAAILPALISSHIKFQWNPQADAAFWKVRESFTLFPILWFPGPQLQFTVEAHASDVGSPL